MELKMIVITDRS